MDKIEVLNAIKESLNDYVSPIFIVGSIEFLKYNQYTSTISATIDKGELIVKNGRYPKWLLPILYNSSYDNSILIITDFDQISTEEQKLFIDIICHNSISSEKLPTNLRIIINSKTDCIIIPEIKEVVEVYSI